MDAQTEQSLREFIAIHQGKLAEEALGKTSLFGDYIAFCREHAYPRHANMVQFCRGCVARAESRQCTNKQEYAA